MNVNDINNLLDDEFKNEEENNKIIISLQQRNSKKYWTIIENLDWLKKFVYKRTLKLFKKVLVCNGSIIENDKNEKIIQLQGNHIEDIKEYFNIYYKLNEDNYIIRGI